MPSRFHFLLWMLGHCAGVYCLAASPPAWWDNPVQEDGGNFFFAASGVSREGEEEAFRLAMSGVYAQIADRVGAGEETNLRNYIATQASGGSLHAREHARSRGRHFVWIIYRLPRGEFDLIRAHIRDAPAKFERAVKAREEGHPAEALALLQKLQAAYPVGEQPVFQTERAGLLAVDCLLDLGKPREALNELRGWLTRNIDEAWRESFSQKLEDVEENFPALLLSSIFRKRSLEITASLELEGTQEEWRRMKTELVTVTTSSGARMEEAIDGQGILQAVATGRMNRRDNDRPSGPGYDSQFVGRVKIVLALPGQEPFTWEREGISGWNPLGREMCLDVVALQMFSAWKADLIKHLDSP